MCGILGIYSQDTDELFSLLLSGLTFLERRGPDSLGASLINPIRNTIVTEKKVSGLERKQDRLETEVEKKYFLQSLERPTFSINAKMCLGQTRYSTDQRIVNANPTTIKAINHANAQPIHINFENYKGIFDQGVGCHNGNIPETEKQRIKNLIDPLSPNIGTVDSRFLVEYYMQVLRENNGDHFASAKHIMNNITGAFSFIFSDGQNLIAFKDRWNVRPLCIGESTNKAKIIISESGFFNHSHLDYTREIRPAEVIRIDQNGTLESKIFDDIETFDGRCPFEAWYFMSHMSLWDNGEKSVDDFRYQIGWDAADYYSETIKILDLVCSIPRSGDSYTRGFAQRSQIKNLECITKASSERFYLKARNSLDRNKNTGGHKYLIQKRDVQNRNVGLIDDSLMRGDSIVKLYIDLKLNKANEVHLFSMWPPNILGCEKGNDTQDKELIAYQLIKTGIIYKKDNICIYDSIEKVNQAATELIKQKVKDLEPSVDSSRLFIHYAPIDILKKHIPQDSCTTCLNGVELPGW